MHNTATANEQIDRNDQMLRNLLPQFMVTYHGNDPAKELAVGDPCDQAQVCYSKELAHAYITIRAKDRQEVAMAITLNKRGAYGICVSCQKQISSGRLAVKPYATRCVTCQDLHERGQY